MQRKVLERVKSVKKIESYTMSDKNGTTFCSQKSNNWYFQFLDLWTFKWGHYTVVNMALSQHLSQVHQVQLMDQMH